MKVKVFKLGATGRRPYGRLANNETDEGELQFAHRAPTTVNGIVRVEFGKGGGSGSGSRSPRRARSPRR
jgi:hypothetical protein